MKKLILLLSLLWASNAWAGNIGSGTIGPQISLIGVPEVSSSTVTTNDAYIENNLFYRGQASNGQLLIGNSSGSFSKNTLTQGSNVTITNGNGTITIASTGGGGGSGTPSGNESEIQYNASNSFGASPNLKYNVTGNIVTLNGGKFTANTGQITGNTISGNSVVSSAISSDRMPIAGFMKNNASGVFSGGNSIVDGDIPATLTRDTEWDTAAEINAATTDVDFSTTTHRHQGETLGVVGLGATTVSANTVSGNTVVGSKIYGFDTVGSASITGNTVSGNTVRADGALTVVSQQWNLGNKIDGAQIATGTVDATQIASTSVATGTYTDTTLTVDADGRLTSASSGVARGLNSLTGYSTANVLQVGGLGTTGMVSGNTISGNTVRGDRFYADSRIGTVGTITGNTISGNSVNVAGLYTLGQTASIPTSQLNTGTNASATTFWRGDGTWNTPAGGGSSGLDSLTGYSTSKVLQVGGLGTPNGSGTVSANTVSGNTINVGGTFSLGQTGSMPVSQLNSGTGATSSTYWRGDATWATPSAANALVSGAVVFTFDGGGSVITTGSTAWFRIPYAATLNEWETVAYITGSTAVDILKSTYGSMPNITSQSKTIVGGEIPTLKNQQRNQDKSLSTWTTGVNAGDYLQALVVSADTVTFTTVTLSYTH